MMRIGILGTVQARLVSQQVIQVIIQPHARTHVVSSNIWPCKQKVGASVTIVMEVRSSIRRYKKRVAQLM